MLLLNAPLPFGSGPVRIRTLVSLLLLFGLSGCSSSGTSGSTAAETPADDGKPPAGDESITFEQTTTLTLAPSEVASLSVLVNPPLKQTVRFEIVRDRRDSEETESAEDGFLLNAEAQVRDDGTASIEVQAPSIPATFLIRASLSEELYAVRAISVSDQGYGEINVKPSYDGDRKIDQWTASARAGVTCEELTSFWEDGALVATGATAATISSVPSGPPIAVTVRGAQLVSGCSTVTGLAPNEMEELVVNVTDRPADITNGTLVLRLGVDSTTTAFAASLEEAISSASVAFWGGATNEGSALLEAMSDNLSKDDSIDFRLAMETYELAAAINNLYRQSSPISSKIFSTLTGAAGTIAGEDIFVGELSLESGTSQFLLTEAAGVPAAVSGFFQGSNWMASVESGDTVVLGGSLTYEPVRWLVAIAEHNASEESAPEILMADAGACADVAATLIQAAEGPTHADCDESCLEDLCIFTLENVWHGLLLAGNGLSTLQIGISGHAELFGAAQVGSIDGSWVGRLAQEETSLKGPAHADAVR